jgi:anti-anti-sigma factor
MMLVVDNLEIELEQQQEKRVVCLRGELTAASGSVLKKTCLDLAEAAPPHDITLDLSGLSYINTAGIALLVASVDNLSQNRAVSTVGLSSHHQRLFRAVGLTHLIAASEDPV